MLGFGNFDGVAGLPSVKAEDKFCIAAGDIFAGTGGRPPKLDSIVCIKFGCILGVAKPTLCAAADLVVMLKFPALDNIPSSFSYCANCFLLNFFCKSTNSSLSLSCFCNCLCCTPCMATLAIPVAAPTAALITKTIGNIGTGVIDANLSFYNVSSKSHLLLVVQIFSCF